MQLNYYNSIDELPIKIWFEIHEKGDLTLLLKKTEKLTLKLLNELDLSWEKIFNEWLRDYGLSDEFRSKFRIQTNIAKYQADYLITKQRHFLTLVEIEKQKLKINFSEMVESIPLEKALAKISKYYGFKLDSRTLTVSQYYAYLENITNG